MTSQRSSSITCPNTGSPSVAFWRRRPPSRSPEEHLAQVGVDHGGEAAARHQGRGGLGRALQGADVDGVEGLLGQPKRGLLSLVAAHLGQRRVALALDEFEGLALEGVADAP